MADQFKYIINAKLQLTPGSLSSLVNEIKTMDRDIKAEFEKAGTSIKVPLTADQDIQRLRTGVNRIVESYNKGQAPSVRIPVVADEHSISKLQARISEVKKQLNSLSDEHARVSVDTSLVVGRNEGEEVQKQVDGIKPTIEVKVIANEQSLRDIKAQIEAIKADVQATVRTVERSNPENLRTFGRADRNEPNRTSSVGSTRNNTGRKINATRGSSVDRFLTDRKALTDEINIIQNNIKLLEKEEKLSLSANEIQKRIDSLQQAQASGTATKWNIRDDKGHIVKGTKTVKSENFENEINYYKSMLRQVDEVNSLKKQLDAKLKSRSTLERTIAYKSPSKSKPTPRSHISPDSSLGQTLSEIEAKKKDEKARQDALDKAEKQIQSEADKAEKKRQSDAEKARIKVQRNNEKTLKRSQQVSYNRLNRGRGTAETQDRRMGYQQHLEDMPNRYVDLSQQKSIIQAKVSELKGVIGKQYNPNKPQALAEVQSMIDKLNKDMESLDNEINIERAKLQEHINKLYGNDSQGRKLQQSLLGGNGKINPNDVVKATVKTQTVANVKAENDAKLRAWNEQKAQEELEKQWSQTGAYSELPSNGRIAKLMARNQARQEYLNRKTQSVSQAKNDYETHTRRYGGNKEYSGTDLEAMLKDPNVNLQDSLEILKNKINPHNARQAYDNKQSFQKAYSISYKDDEGNIRNIRTLTYEYTKLGETIERGDKGFTSMLSHIGTKVGVFSLLEGAMFAVIGAVAKGVEDMAKFDAQLAEVVATTKDLNSEGNKLQSFYSQGQNGITGTASMESQVQNDTFQNAETYGVSALNTVMPIEQQVIARHNLVSGNGGYDSTMKDQIVQKIMQFSAISTGGEATPEETNDLTKDSLSLYQAYYNPDDPNQHIKKMNSLFDNLTSMRMRGVNTTAVTDAMAELAPDTLTAGIDSNQVISALGAYNLADASATGSDIQTVGRTFFGSLRHANTNDNLKSSLQQYMGIDLNTQSMPASDLLNKIIKTFPTLNDTQQEQFAQAFAGTSGKGIAMTPKMVKLLQSFNGPDYNNFMENDTNGKNQGAMDKSWLPFSDRLKTNFDNLVEKLQEFTQLIGRLGVLDGLNAIVGAFSKILDVVNAVLRATQNVSDFFDNKNIWNIPKHTIELVSFMTTLKALTALLNKAKFGGAIGDILAMSPITGRMGVRTTAQRISAGEATVGETMGMTAPFVNMNRNTSNDTTKISRTIEQEATSNVAKTAENAIQFENHVKMPISGSQMSSMLDEVITFSTADVIATKLKNNPAFSSLEQQMTRDVVSKAPVTAIGSVTSQAFNRTALDSAIATTTKREGMSTGGKVLDSVGSFMSDALMIGMLKGKGRAGVAEDVTKAGTGIVKKITTGFIEMLPALRGFGLLLTRVSLIGAVITAGIWTVQALVNRAKQVAESEQAKTQTNMKRNLAEAQKDPEVKKQMNVNVDKWLKDNQDLLNLGRKTQVNGDYSYKDLQKRATLSDRLQNMKSQYGLEYTTDSKGKSVVHYDNGKKTATVGNKKQMQEFRDFYNNGGLTNVQKLSDAWKVNTDNLTSYQNELATVNVLSKNLAETMKQIDVGQKSVDANYGGVTSSGSLDAKISIAKKGLADSKSMGIQLQARADDIRLEYERSSTKYNGEVNKALGTNIISKSDIEDAVQQLEVAKSLNKPPQTVIDNYKTLDPTNSEDAKTIKSKKYSKSELSDLNTKNAAISAVLQTYQQYSGSQDLYNQSQDALDQYKEQKSQYEESVKQMTAQSMVAKLGLDALSASLQQLGAVASASKTLVDMNENVLNTGDNSAQIGALHSSMQVSTSQMNGMLSQQNIIQSAMDKIKSANPNQDFSLNTLYDPKDPSGVSPEQIAYKSLYEQSQQMTQNIANQSSAMYQQVQQLRDLVFNSTEYADSWSRIQQTVQDVKDSIKSANDFQYQMATVNENSLTTAGMTGQKITDVRQQQLQAIRDNSLNITTKLTTDKASFDADISNLNKAWTQIMQEEGASFNNNMVKPLNGIVGNFGNAVGEFGKDVNANNDNMQKAIDSIKTAVSQQASQSPVSSASQPAGGSTSQYGTVTSTGQSFQLGFQEKSYNSILSSVSRGMYKGNESAFVQAGALYGVDPELLMSIALSENSGDSNILNHSFNIGNIKGTGDAGSYEGYRKYSSLQAGVNDLAKLLASKISSGYTTIPTINSAYAEDPKWKMNVASYMAKMTGTSQSTWIGDAGVDSGFNIGGSHAFTKSANAVGTTYSGSSVISSGGGGSSYTGGSIVDYLNSIGQSTSFSHREELAKQYGISGYSGTASQNLSLLNKMRSSGGSSGGGGSAPSTSVGGALSGYNFAITSGYGGRTSPINGQGEKHTGIDIAAPKGTPLSADVTGKVIASGTYGPGSGYNGFGNVVVIKDAITGLEHMYAHLNDTLVKVGDQVTEGQLVAHTGATGKATGPHLHYEIRQNGYGTDIDPTQYLNQAKAYTGNATTGAIAGSPQASAPNPDPLQSYKDTNNASIALVQGVIPQMVQKINDDIGQALWNGNIADVMGTSGITAKFDRIAQARQDIGTKMSDNREQIDVLNQKHDMYVDQMNNAYNNGDVSAYNTAHAYTAITDELIYTLQQNTNQLQSLDDQYKAQMNNDPRLSNAPASQAIVGGVQQLQSYVNNNQGESVDYFRVANELGNMQSQYMTHAKGTSILKNVFDNWGQQSQMYTYSKGVSDKDQQNLFYTQLSNITNVLNGFAKGTQDWYSALNTTVEVQKQILNLEQQRLDDAQSNFENTGTDVQPYIEQKAYVQSRNYTNADTGLQNALSSYQSGNMLANNQYGIQFPEWHNADSSNPNYAHDATSWMQQWLFNTYGYNATPVQTSDQIGAGYTLVGQSNLSQQKANDMLNTMMGKYIGTGNVTQGGYGLQMPNWYDKDNSNPDYAKGSVDSIQQYLKNTWGWDTTEQKVNDQYGTGWSLKGDSTLTQEQSSGMINSMVSNGWMNSGGSNGVNLITPTTNNTMDLNQQLANLQIIADAHNKMTQQITDYKTAVADAFKAGAMSVDEYISKLNQLRDVQTEQKDNAVSMVGNVQSGFSSALSDALTQGMQGSINSPVDFMNSIKSTLSSSISGQLTNTLLNNTGLQDVMNKISTSVATASTSGSPEDIVNMFNNNDFGKQMQDAIAPFLPMIQQLVGSTKGIFTILKDQVYNAPSGFKVNNYMNEIASSVGYEGIKTMNPNVNGVGSPTLNFDSGSQINTTDPSQTPTGIPTGISTPSNGTTGQTGTGAPENTTGTGTGAPDTSSYTNAPWVSNKPYQASPPAPPAPPPAPAPSPSSTSTYTVVRGDTLSGIGSKLHVGWQTIASLNGIKSPYRIYPGQVLKISGGSSGGGGSSSGGGGGSTKHTSSSVNFRSSAGYGNNVIGSIPKGAAVSYLGNVSGWAHVSYNGKTGYVGPSYLYHTGGIAGVTNFASGQGLKPNELSAILQKSETIFQPKQLDDLVNGAMQAGVNSNSSGGGVNINVMVNFSGDTSDKGTIEQTVNTAVQKALQEFKKTTRLSNLSWKGTSY